MSSVYKMGVAEAPKDDDEMVAFSIRIPRAVADKIDAMRRYSKRSRNMEITLMLEKIIEIQEQNDREIVERIAQLNSGLKNSSSQTEP